MSSSCILLQTGTSSTSSSNAAYPNGLKENPNPSAKEIGLFYVKNCSLIDDEVHVILEQRRYLNVNRLQWDFADFPRLICEHGLGRRVTDSVDSEMRDGRDS